MHSADHQHMGKPGAPVGTAQFGRQMSAVAHRHSGQYSAGAAVHPAAQRAAQSLLQAAGAGAETAALAQNFEFRFFLVRLCQQGDAVGIPLDLVVLLRSRQNKPPAHTLACFTRAQRLALRPEGCRFAVHRLHTEHCIHDAAVVGIRDLFHFSGQHDGAPGILHPGAFQPGICGIHCCHPGRSPKQQAHRRLAGGIRQAEQQTKGNKKCRKRHKKSRLRQKGAH